MKANFLWADIQSKHFKKRILFRDPTLFQFLCLSFQSHNNSFKKCDFKNTVYLVLCLQPPAQSVTFSLLLDRAVCMYVAVCKYGKRQKRGKFRRAEPTPAWGCCHWPGRGAHEPFHLLCHRKGAELPSAYFLRSSAKQRNKRTAAVVKSTSNTNCDD